MVEPRAIWSPHFASKDFSLWAAGSGIGEQHRWIGVRARDGGPGQRASACVDHRQERDRVHPRREGFGCDLRLGFRRDVFGFCHQGLAPAGQLVKKEQFAPLAKENAGSLAEIGYFTTLKIGGKSMDFDLVTDYWMQERPDHLVEFHVTLPLKTPTQSPSSSRFGWPIRNFSSISSSTTRSR